MAKKAKKKTPKKGKNHAQNKRKQTKQNAQNPQKNQAPQSKPQAPESSVTAIPLPSIPPKNVPYNVLASPPGMDYFTKLKPEKRYGWGGIGDSQLFAEWVKGCARYVPDRKTWLVYDGTRWETDIGGLKTMEHLKQCAKLLKKYAETIPVTPQSNYSEHIKSWQRRGGRDSILKDAAGVYPVPYIVFDNDPFLLNCKNGTLDLRKWEFRAHNPDDLLTKMANVTYDPDATCPRWEQFIDEVTQGDKELAEFIQKVFGYALTGDTSNECMFILFGSRSRNGKSTALEVILHMLGDYGRIAKPETIATKLNANSSGPSEDLARLAGARFVEISEPDKKLSLSASTVKTMTGGSTLMARFLHENSFEFRVQFKLFIDTNYLPEVNDNTLFVSDRVKVIPFNRYFSEEERDIHLKATLQQPDSISGVLNWCLRGYKMMQQTGLTCPPAVLEATAEYQADSDKMTRFVNDELDTAPNDEVRTSEAFVRYQGWCIENGFKAGSIKTFTQEISKVVTVERKRPKGGGEKTTLIVGRALRFKLPYG